ncbi:MAG: hypothetical protein ACYTHJ_04470 [Planctomycetota bacterium]
MQLRADFPVSQACPSCVVVAVDLDPASPGWQTHIQVEPGTEVVEGVAVWVYDPAGQAAPLHDVGYVGGLNRGLSIGHVPDPANAGEVVGMNATVVAPVVAGHTASVSFDGIEKMFVGPELQYFEFGGAGIIPSAPVAPIMLIDIALSDAEIGDAFTIYLGDMTATWRAQWPVELGGAFSTSGTGTLDAGGDAVPDGTESAYGVDADVPMSAPPAPYQVDYLDGGGAVIQVGAGVPTVSTWGIVLMGCLVLVSGSLVFAARGRTHGC